MSQLRITPQIQAGCDFDEIDFTSVDISSNKVAENTKVESDKQKKREKRQVTPSLDHSKLGSTQRKGCPGDFCDFDWKGLIDKYGTQNALFQKSKGTKSHSTSDFLNELIALQQSEEANLGEKHLIPKFVILQAKQEHKQVEVMLKRLADGTAGDYLKEFKIDNSFESAFAGNVYSNVQVCNNCFIIYRKMLDERSRAERKLGGNDRKSKRMMRSEELYTGQDNTTTTHNFHISKDDLDTFKNANNPSTSIKLIGTALVMLLTGERLDNWLDIKSTLNRRDLVYALMGFHFSMLGGKTLDRLHRYFSEKHCGLRPDRLERSSKSAANVCRWILNMVTLALDHQQIPHDDLFQETFEGGFDGSNSQSLSQLMFNNSLNESQLDFQHKLHRRKKQRNVRPKSHGNMLKKSDISQTVRPPSCPSPAQSMETGVTSPDHLPSLRTTNLSIPNTTKPMSHMTHSSIKNRFSSNNTSLATRSCSTRPVYEPQNKKQQVQLLQMNRLANPSGAALGSTTSNSIQEHCYTSVDGQTKLPYEVLGNADLTLSHRAFVVIPDFFDTREATKIQLRPIEARYQYSQILLFNLPGQGDTKYPRDQPLNNDFIAECISGLLQHVNKSAEFITEERPLVFLGIGNGANIAIRFNAMYENRYPNLSSFLFLNPFANVDDHLAKILYQGIQVFETMKSHGVVLANDARNYHAQLIFSQLYLNKYRGIALSIYNAVTNNINIDGCIDIFEGVLRHTDIRNDVKKCNKPMIIIQSTLNNLIAPSNLESFTTGKRDQNVYEHTIAETEQSGVSLMQTGNRPQLLKDTLKSERSVLTIFTEAGHEIRQEKKELFLDVVDSIAAGDRKLTKHVAEEVTHQKKVEIKRRNRYIKDNATKREQTRQEINEVPTMDLKLRSSVSSKINRDSYVSVSPIRLRGKNQDKVSTKSRKQLFPTASATAFSNLLPQAPPLDIKNEMEQLRKTLSLTQEKFEKEQQETEHRIENEYEKRLAAIRSAQQRRKQQWEREDRERRRKLEKDLQLDGLHALEEERNRAQQEFAKKEAEVQRATEERRRLEKHAEPKLGSILDSIVEAHNPGKNVSKEKNGKGATVSDAIEVIQKMEQTKGSMERLSADEFNQVQLEQKVAEQDRQVAIDVIDKARISVRQTEAATKIQALWRGGMGRQKAMEKAREITFFKFKEQAAVLIQALVRGFIGRQRAIERRKEVALYEGRVTAARLLQRVYRGYVGRKQAWAQRMWSSALTIQRIYRGHADRVRAKQAIENQKRRQIERKAATCIQSIWRMFSAVKHFASSRVSHLAALQIQRVFRGYIGRMRAAKRREWVNTEPGHERMALGLQRITAAKMHDKKYKQELDALYHDLSKEKNIRETVVKDIAATQKEMDVLQEELRAIESLENEILALTHKRQNLTDLNENDAEKEVKLIQSGKVGLTPEERMAAFKRQEELRNVEMEIAQKQIRRQKKQNEIEAEWNILAGLMDQKKKRHEDIENKIRAMEEDRQRKHREFERVGENLAEMMETQKLELAKISRKGVQLSEMNRAAVKASADAAQRAMELEANQSANSKAMEQLIKFNFLAMSQSHMTTLGFLQNMQKANADTTSALTSTLQTNAKAQAANMLAAAINPIIDGDVNDNHAEQALLRNEVPKPSTIKQDDLNEMQKRVEKARKHQFPEEINEWTVTDVAMWLETISLPQYKVAFVEGTVDGKMLMRLDDQLLKTLGVTHLVHIAKLKAERNDIRSLTSFEDKLKREVQREEKADALREVTDLNGEICDVDQVFSWIRHKRHKKVDAALNTGSFNVDAEDDFGNSALIIACQNTNQKMVELLVQHGANLNHQNHAGNTACHYAMAYDIKGDLAAFLIEHGASDAIENKLGLTCHDGIDLLMV